MEGEPCDPRDLPFNHAQIKLCGSYENWLSAQRSLAGIVDDSPDDNIDSVPSDSRTGEDDPNTKVHHGARVLRNMGGFKHATLGPDWLALDASDIVEDVIHDYLPTLANKKLLGTPPRSCTVCDDLVHILH